MDTIIGKDEALAFLVGHLGLWGYYVCPLLHRGRFVGRFEGWRREQRIEVLNLWKEEGEAFDDVAWREALGRLEEAG